MVPRSLRWEVTPQSEYFNKAGLSLLQFLLVKKKQQLLKLDEEIGALKEKLVPFKNNDDYNKRSEVLKKTFRERGDRTKNKENNKYPRDLEDYKNNNVFKWQSKEGPMGGPNPIGGSRAVESL